jgi:hypothetical protein
MVVHVQCDGQVAASDHCGARHALGPEHPQDVQRRRPVDKIAALVRGGGPKQFRLIKHVHDHAPVIRRRAYDASVASGKPRISHGRGDLVEELRVGFHFGNYIFDKYAKSRKALAS